MPERSYEALLKDQSRLNQAIRYTPGYDWIPGRFGPPPGILKSTKDQLDQLSDRDYLFAFMKLSQEEKESLMISEAERRRTFTSHWPIWNIVDGFACAKEGFYYTGVSDRVQCAFCAGIIRNWERGDSPKESHQKYFSYCKMAQRKPCHNIPFDKSDMPKELMTEQLSTNSKHDFQDIRMSDLGIVDNRPSHPKYSVARERISSFETYNASKYPISPDDLSAAGFFYEGPADKVRCFWCSGALELWTRGDDPWWEHARINQSENGLLNDDDYDAISSIAWYPGCVFMRQNKGVKFITSARSSMSDEEIKTANTLNYNSDDTSFLDEKACEDDVKKLDTYVICKSLGYSDELLVRAFDKTEGKEYRDIQDLITVLNALLTDADEDIIEEIVKSNCTQSKAFPSRDGSNGSNKDTNMVRYKLQDLVSKPGDLTEEENEILIDAMTCHQCNVNQVGAVVLPCGHFCLCHSCSKKNLPDRCPHCDGVVKGACRVYLN